MESDLQYFNKGDTLINNIQYHKVLKTGNGVEYIMTQLTCSLWCGSNYNYYSFNSIYTGALRQNIAQRRLYYMEPGQFQEALLYDYSLSVGDTLPTSYTNQIVNIVTAIDTLWLGGTGHRSFQLSSSLFMGDVSLIEGIGCSLGLFSPCSEM